MSLKEKIDLIEESFAFSSQEMSLLLDIPKEKYEKVKSGSSDIQIENIIDDLFGMDKGNSKIVLKHHLNKEEYSNALIVYSEVLKKYFSNKDIYVLSKIKKRNKIKSIFDILFNNSKKAVMREMKAFAPSYLIINNEKKILVTIEDWTLIASNLPDDIETEKFEFENYIYRRANKLTIK